MVRGSGRDISIAITGIDLQSYGQNHIYVSVRYNGQWYAVIDEPVVDVGGLINRDLRARQIRDAMGLWVRKEE